MSGNLGKYDHSRIIVRDTMKKKRPKWEFWESTMMIFGTNMENNGITHDKT